MRRFIVCLLFIITASCADVADVLPKYEPFHMEMLAFLYTSTQELSLYCPEKKSPKLLELLQSLRKNSVYLKNHMHGLGITGIHDYSINIWNPIKEMHELYKTQGDISEYFCKEQTANIQNIIEKGMQIERLRRNR